MKFPKELYCGFQADRYRGADIPRLLGFITGKDNTKASQKRMKTVDGWRQKDIDPKTYENKPLSGFKIVDFATRWSTSNKLIRIYDPRGFELEISVENLLTLIETHTIVNGEIIGKLLWGGDSAKVLVSENDPIYKASLTQAASEMSDDTSVLYRDNAGVRFYRYLGPVYIAKVNKSIAQSVKPGAKKIRPGYMYSYSFNANNYNPEDVINDVTFEVNRNVKQKYHIYAFWYKSRDTWKVSYELRSSKYKGLIISDSTDELRPEDELICETNIDKLDRNKVHNNVNDIVFFFTKKEDRDTFDFIPNPLSKYFSYYYIKPENKNNVKINYL